MKRVRVVDAPKISMVTCSSLTNSFGGGVTYAKQMKKALDEAGADCDLTTYDKIGDPDVLLLGSIGVNGENGKSAAAANAKRFEVLDRYYGRIPIAVVVHTTTELSVFRKSRDYWDGKEFDAVIIIDESEALTSYVAKNFRSKRTVCIRHPFEFNDEFFEDKTPHRNNVASTARIAGSKRTDMILKMAHRSKKKFEIWSAEKGIYWYHQIKCAPEYDPSYFKGEHGSYVGIPYNVPYEENAFCIDLTLFSYGKLYDGGRTQYSTLEAIDCGLIPIGFDVWKEGWDDCYDGVWLPAPKKNGNRYVWELDEYLRIIDGSRYEYDMAVDNRERMKEICDLEKIGTEVRELLESAI